MIQKFLAIKNVGKLKNVTFGSPNWNGILEKCTAIYADNGSGKTTFTQILKSTQNAKVAEELMVKKTFGSDSEIDISYINDKKQQCHYKNGKWNNYDNQIDVFDSYFVENNIYIITLGNYDEPGSYYEIIVGNEAIRIFNEIKKLVKKRKTETTKRRNWNRTKKESTNEEMIHSIDEKIIKSRALSAEISKKLKKLEEKQVKEAEHFGKTYMEKINVHLQRLGTEMKLTRLNKIANKFVYYISISDYELRSESNNISLSHTLSEGEKNCLAFAFFLARLDLRKDLDKRSVVFDDPISSLDANRRKITLNILTRIAKQCNQFIMLSHDINFIRDFKCNIKETLILKICKSSQSSQINNFDVEKETLTGIFKDVLMLREFADNGESSGNNPRDIVRCIRPVIEGFFRLKYYLHINEGEWLGDFISKVRNSKKGEPFYAQKIVLNDLEDLNDYSKTYHHSNPHYLEEPITSSELQYYCKLVFSVIEKI